MFDFPYKSLILATPSDACGERLITAPMLHSFSIYFYLNRRRDKRSWKPLRMDQGYRNGTPSIMAWFAFIPSVYMLVFRFHITWWNTQVSWTCTWGWFFCLYFAVLDYKSVLFQRDWRLSHHWCWIISCRKIDRFINSSPLIVFELFKHIVFYLETVNCYCSWKKLNEND